MPTLSNMLLQYWGKLELKFVANYKTGKIVP